MSTLRVKHLLPGLGALPADPRVDGVSGLVGSTLGIAFAQAARGYDVEVVGWRPGDRPRDRRIDGVTLRSTPGWPWAKLGSLDFRVIGPVVTRASLSPPADVLHASSAPHLLLARRARARVLHYQTPLPRPLPRSYAGLLHQADAIVFCSQYLRAAFHDIVDYPMQRTVVVYNGVQLEKHQDHEGSSERGRWGIGSDDLVVLFAGAIVPEKGLDDLVAAVEPLAADRPLHLVVAGGSGLWQVPDAPGATTRSPYELEARQAAGRLPRVSWLGVVPTARMPSVFAMADVVACPSRWGDPFPLVVLEAMAAGKPVVASRAGGIPEAVDDGVTGILCPPGDRPAFAGALRRLLDDAELRTRMGRAAQRRAELFTWDAASQHLDIAYERILGRAAIGARSEPLSAHR